MECTQGVLRLNHISDELLKDAAPEVVVVRPCNYFENWRGAIKTARGDPSTFDSTFHPPGFKIPMVRCP